jgi:hypothetical protein
MDGTIMAVATPTVYSKLGGKTGKSGASAALVQYAGKRVKKARKAAKPVPKKTAARGKNAKP